MTVNVNGHSSRPVYINVDGPCVSLLESTFFLIFTNDHPGCTSSKLGHFSDDTAISSSVNSKSDSFDEVKFAID